MNEFFKYVEQAIKWRLVQNGMWSEEEQEKKTSLEELYEEYREKDLILTQEKWDKIYGR